MAKSKWTEQRLTLPQNTAFTAAPGYVLFVAGRGAVHFEVPENWIVKPTDDSIHFYDKDPPDDDCVLQASVHHIDPRLDLTGLPVRDMVEALEDGDDDADRRTLGVGQIVGKTRGEIQYAWRESRFLDVKQNREACNRLCLARGRYNIQTLITLDFWPEDLTRLHPIWTHVLATLKIGEFIDDPLTHVLH